MRKALIFDIDGTLWDAAEQIRTIWNRVIHSLGIERTLTMQDIRGIMGTRIEEIGSIFFPDLPAAESLKIMQKCAAAQIGYLRENGGRVYDGVPETLRQLSASCDLFLVSNCPVGYAEAFMACSGTAPYFKDYEISGRTGKTKGDNIKILMARNHLSDCIYIGDTKGDQQAAAYAGIPFIHAAYGFGTVEDAAAVIHSIRELPSILR